MSSETVKPIPPIVPPLASAAQPTGVGFVRDWRWRRVPWRGSSRRACPGRNPPHAERDRRTERMGEKTFTHDDASVCECEERHDEIASPRMELHLKPLIRRDGQLQAESRRTLQLRRWLLTEASEEVARSFEVPSSWRDSRT